MFLISCSGRYATQVGFLGWMKRTQLFIAHSASARRQAAAQSGWVAHVLSARLSIDPLCKLIIHDGRRFCTSSTVPGPWKKQEGRDCPTAQRQDEHANDFCASIRECSDVAAVLRLAESTERALNQSELAASWKWLGRRFRGPKKTRHAGQLERKDHVLLAERLARTTFQSLQKDDWTVGNIKCAAVAIARLRPPVLDHRVRWVLQDWLAKRCKAGLETFTAAEMVDLMWAFGEFEGKSDIVGICARRLPAVLKDLSEKHICNVALTVIKTKHDAGELFAELRKELSRRGVNEFADQGLSSLICAFAKVDGDFSDLFAAVAEEVARRRVCEFTPQGLSNTVWAFATVKQDAPDVFEIVAEEMNRRGVVEFSAQEVSNAVWAFSMAKVPTPELFATVAKEVDRRGFGEFNSQDIAQTVWAFGTLVEMKNQAHVKRPAKQLIERTQAV
eukprot:TRINITY_DN45647_c0_g1_i1.p1 TRINITY_DN45647_c0_g1~~TRINITY_DN45647_c0_g1_i1.p1  ORF type:complete len:446 (+),score=39.21 TRINITY_DN45647_c0_g1_i1:204-1541(+)